MPPPPMQHVSATSCLTVLSANVSVSTGQGLLNAEGRAFEGHLLVHPCDRASSLTGRRLM